MGTWLAQNAVGIMGIAVGGFIAYHVYFLSLRIDLRDMLEHKNRVRKEVEPLLHKIRSGWSSKVEIVNVKKYLVHYPGSNERTKDGYTYLGAELKGLCFDGVEFFCAVRESYELPDGSLSLKGGDGRKQSRNVLEVGVIPYKWIEYIDPRGDEYGWRPQFFTQFNGLEKYPYKYLTYCIESDTYHPESDPMEFKWRKIDIARV